MLLHKVTMPIDVVKVRLQISGSDGKKIYAGMLDAFVATVQKEGVGALFKGLPPALLRQVPGRGRMQY